MGAGSSRMLGDYSLTSTLSGDVEDMPHGAATMLDVVGFDKANPVHVTQDCVDTDLKDAMEPVVHAQGVPSFVLSTCGCEVCAGFVGVTCRRITLIRQDDAVQWVYIEGRAFGSEVLTVDEAGDGGQYIARDKALYAESRAVALLFARLCAPPGQDVPVDNVILYQYR